MNVNKNDYRGLLNQVAIAVDKNFSEQQILSLLETMQTLGWKGSYRIVVKITRTGNIPKNVYGHTLALLEDEIEYQKKKLFQKEDWSVADEDCASPEEFKLTMQCIGLICRFNDSADLCRRFAEYLGKAVNDNHLLESLQKAKKFYTEQYEKKINLKIDRDLSKIF